MHKFDADPANWREEDLEREAEKAAKILAWMDDGQRELDEITGTGEAANGQVKAVAAVDGTVRDIVITPRAMRLDSRTLAEQLTLAVGRAQDDAERQSRQLMADALGDLLPDGRLDLRAFEEQLGRLLRSFERP
ncbi:YbaB/EbfC family nucleoid-associated protein [Nonomuraea bangladeshensis]|uniref:YbaB/EbfC family nucleoid-associated protein n=1 Tax=Nonomuraea bangladeshensis TaxID=404385 RepID=UPI0031D71BCD